MTGFQEAIKFRSHLRKCRKNPNNIVTKINGKTVVDQKKDQDLMDAVEIRAASGQ
jgi:hypothetical protein